VNTLPNNLKIPSYKTVPFVGSSSTSIALLECIHSSAQPCCSLDLPQKETKSTSDVAGSTIIIVLSSLDYPPFIVVNKWSRVYFSFEINHSQPSPAIMVYIKFSTLTNSIFGSSNNVINIGLATLEIILCSKK